LSCCCMLASRACLASSRCLRVLRRLPEPPGSCSCPDIANYCFNPCCSHQHCQGRHSS
jgi:hypothetical protein